MRFFEWLRAFVRRTNKTEVLHQYELSRAHTETILVLKEQLAFERDRTRLERERADKLELQFMGLYKAVHSVQPEPARRQTAQTLRVQLEEKYRLMAEELTKKAGNNADA